MPTLHWIGKEKVVNHHLDVPFKTLEKQYTFKDGKESKEGTSENKIIHGDNLEALKSLLPEYEGKIKCIYIDPPYNTGNEGWVYNDNVNHPKIKKWLGEVVGKEGEDLSRHDKWLCMMYPRLKLLHKLLSDDGVIFISIDDNEQSHLKLLLDEIFGHSNFIANIMWKRKKENSNDSKNISFKGEYILCYSKSKKVEIKNERLSSDYIRKSYKKPNDKYPKDYWRPVPITVSKGLNGGGYEYEIVSPKGFKHKRVWAYPQDSYQKLESEGLIYFGVKGDAIPQRVMYLSDSKGKPTSNYWDSLSSNKEGKKDIINIFKGNYFNTPKPKALIEKILTLSTEDNDIILDSFAGSGTTAHAVLNLNKEDGGNRKFILIEMEDYANDITAERVKRVIKGYGKGKKAVEGTGGDFEFLKLGKPLFDKDGYINEDQPLEDIRKYVYYSETKTNTGYSANPKNKYYLGKRSGTGYYFYYKDNAVTTLDLDFASKIKIKADQYIVYADKCTLSQEFMRENNIIFKKIPRDIAKI